MFFRQLLHEEKSCISYAVGCPARGVMAVIDPQEDTDIYLQIAKRNNLKLTHIIETHVQADHLSGALSLSKMTNASVYYHAEAPIKFSHEKLQEGDTLQVGNRHIKIIHTPGHTNDSMTLFVDDWFILTGDTLFVGDVGRVDLSLEENDSVKTKQQAEKLYDSIFNKLLKLPECTEVFPGHYAGSSCGKNMDGKPSSTIGREKRFNHTLQLQSKELFVDYLTKNTPIPPRDYKLIKQKNLGLI